MASILLRNWPNRNTAAVTEITGSLHAAKHCREVAEELCVVFGTAPAVACRGGYLQPARSAANILTKVTLERPAIGAQGLVMDVELVLSPLALWVAQQCTANLEALAIQHAASSLCRIPHPIPILSSVPSFLDLLRATKLHGWVGKVSVEKAAVVLASEDDIAAAAPATALDTFAVVFTTAVMRMVGTVHEIASCRIRQPISVFQIVKRAVHAHLHKRAQNPKP